MTRSKSSLPERLKLLRTEKNLSQNALADLLGLSRGIIGNYEVGARAPDYNTLKVFANFFDVSIDFLLGETEIRQRILSAAQAKKYSTLLIQLEELPDDMQTLLEKSLIFADLLNAMDQLSAESIIDIKRYIELLQLRDKVHLGELVFSHQNDDAI